MKVMFGMEQYDEADNWKFQKGVQNSGTYPEYQNIVRQKMCKCEKDDSDFIELNLSGPYEMLFRICKRTKRKLYMITWL